jgi:hypothetical protein
VSETRVRGAFALRLAITNHRTRDEDLRIFLETVTELGADRAAATHQAVE